MMGHNDSLLAISGLTQLRIRGMARVMVTPAQCTKLLFNGYAIIFMSLTI